MLLLILVFSFIFGLTSCAVCETTYTYLVYNDSFTKGEKDSLLLYGYVKGTEKVPLHSTTETDYDTTTNRTLLTITPTESDTVFLRLWENEGRLLLLRKSTYIEIYDSIRGGVVKDVEVETVNLAPPIETGWSKQRAIFLNENQ